MAVLSASILVSLLFGRKYLLNLSYAQTFLILVFWTPGVNKDLEVFTSWFQFSKLDLGYLYYSGLGSVFDCSTESTKMANLQFGCQSFVLNYFWVLTIFIVIIVIYKLLDAVEHKITIVGSIMNQINNRFPSSLIVWAFIHLFYRLMLINIIALDLVMVRSHAFISCVSIVITIWTVVYFCRKWQLFSLDFLESIDRKNNLSFTRISFVEYSFLSILFISESIIAQVVSSILYLWWEIIIIIQQLKIDKTSTTKELALQRFSTIIKTSYNFILSMVVFIYKLFMFGANQRLMVLLATWSFILWLAIELLSDLSNIFIEKIYNSKSI